MHSCCLFHRPLQHFLHDLPCICFVTHLHVPHKHTRQLHILLPILAVSWPGNKMKGRIWESSQNKTFQRVGYSGTSFLGTGCTQFPSQEIDRCQLWRVQEVSCSHEKGAWFCQVLRRCRVAAEPAIWLHRVCWHCLWDQLDASMDNAIRITLASCKRHNLSKDRQISRLQQFSVLWRASGQHQRDVSVIILDLPEITYYSCSVAV